MTKSTDASRAALSGREITSTATKSRSGPRANAHPASPRAKPAQPGRRGSLRSKQACAEDDETFHSDGMPSRSAKAQSKQKKVRHDSRSANSRAHAWSGELDHTYPPIDAPYSIDDLAHIASVVEALSIRIDDHDDPSPRAGVARPTSLTYAFIGARRPSFHDGSERTSADLLPLALAKTGRAIV